METKPLVSIVTPSYNKATFIEETILSVKNQTYPHIEHLVIDGGSTDGTLDILRKYSDSLTWISEPDKGQADAINKGWKMAKGEILAYLNADDTYMPWAVETAVKFLNDDPDVGMLYGECNIIDENGKVIGRFGAEDFELKKIICDRCIVPQPAAFLRRAVLDKVGYLNTSLYMAMDLELWIRISMRFKVKYVPHVLANFRLSPSAKTSSETPRFSRDRFAILDETFSNLELPEEIRSLRNQAYSYAHFEAAWIYCQQRRRREACKHLVKSVVIWPNRLRDDRVYATLAETLFGKRLTKTPIGWASSLKAKFRKDSSQPRRC